MTNSGNSLNDPKVEFLEICEASFQNAVAAFPELLQDGANTEALAGIAKSCYDAFRQAVIDYAEKNIIPTVSGGDSHNFINEDDGTRTDNGKVNLGFALNAVYGFHTSHQAIINPKSIKAMAALQPIADAIHTRDFAICT